LSVVFSSFSERKDRLIELMNKDVESMGYVIDNLNKKDVNQRLLLVNIQKLVLIDPATMKNFIENQHEFIRNIPKTILSFNFLKRTEREANMSLAQVLGKESETNLEDILVRYFNKNTENESLDTLNDNLNNFKQMKDYSELVKGRIQENGANLDTIPSFDALSMILNIE